MKFKKFYLIKETTSEQKYVVIYGGRFQPATSNHYEVYKHLIDKFGKNNVYIATSDKIEPEKSSFSFNEKKKILTTMFNIPADKIVKTRVPFVPNEILESFSKDTVFVPVFGEKDKGRLSGKYFVPFKNEKNMSGWEDHGYYYIAPMANLKYKGKLISGTAVRDIFKNSDEKEKKEFFTKLYGHFDKNIYDLLNKKIEESELFDGELLNEGGFAVSNVSPIEQKFVSNTINKLENSILKSLRLTKKGIDYEILGSAGKKAAPSGDLDVAINILSIIQNNKLKTTNDVIPFIESIIKNNTENYVVMKGLGTISFSFPIVGETNKNVQIDFMLNDNMEFTIWSHWSPRESETQFKKMGIYRNLLLSAIASEIKKEIVEKFDTGEDKKIKKLFFDFTNGLGEKITNFEGKSGNFLKTGRVESKQILSTTPQEIIKILLGQDATINDTNSFETIWKKVHDNNFPYKNKINNIKSNMKSGLLTLGLPIPQEIN